MFINNKGRDELTHGIEETRVPTRRAALIYALTPVLLSACGGGSSDAAPPITPPPDAPPPVAPPPGTLPEITRAPADLSAAAGGAAVFSVEVNNGNAATYQWLRNGAEIAGATESSLTYAPVSLLESGAVFSVRVTNAAGSVTSPAATLTVTSRTLTFVAGSLEQSGDVDAVGSSARFEAPAPMTVDDAGNVYTGARSTGPGYTGTRSLIRKVAPDGTVTSFSGARGEAASLDGSGSSARFVDIVGLVFDRARKLLVVVDRSSLGASSYLVREVTLDAQVSTRQSLPSTPIFQVALAPGGTLYLAGGNVVRSALPGDFVATAVYKVPLGGTPTLLAGDPQAQGLDDGPGLNARFFSVLALAADAAGNVLVADTYRLRRINPDGTVQTLAGVQEASTAVVDGQGTAARFSWPNSLALENSGNVLVYDRELIRRVTPEGRVITIARTFPAGVGGLAMDNIGRLHVTGYSWVARFEAFAP